MFSPRHFIKSKSLRGSARRLVDTLYLWIFATKIRARQRDPLGLPLSRKVALLLFFLEHLQKAEDRFKRMKFPCDRGGSVTRVRILRSLRLTLRRMCAQIRSTMGGTISRARQRQFPHTEFPFELICMRNILCMRYTHIVRSFWISLKIYFQFDMNASYCKIDNWKDSIWTLWHA